MKRILAIVIVVITVFVLASCGTGNNHGNTTTTNNGTTTTTNSTGEKDTTKTTETTANPTGAKLTGSLNIIDLEDRDPSVLRGVRIAGNRVGQATGINSKEFSLTDVRCIFELDEWIEFYPDTDATYGLRVWILKHRDDQSYYNTCKFSDLMPNFANYCDLHYPEDAENPDEWYWGNFYLHQEDCEPGYYDFVFTYEGKAIAVLTTRFYKVGEISDKSDAELEALMHE